MAPSRESRSDSVDSAFHENSGEVAATFVASNIGIFGGNCLQSISDMRNGTDNFEMMPQNREPSCYVCEGVHVVLVPETHVMCSDYAKPV